MPMMPRTTAGITAITFTATKSLGMNLGLKRPKSPLYLNPWKAELRRSVVKVATIQQKKTCQESLFFQKDETSSMAKSKPPTGAPNAEAIPEERDQRGVCLQACDWSIFPKSYSLIGRNWPRVGHRFFLYIFWTRMFDKKTILQGVRKLWSK